ncbi:unnamed protein product [Pieris brassicae]|uniref:Uncharacterized protein n=1 Tax=Pieris brassicae TaxID=7116 RepID=A0A9P0U0L1_PIEBR|nr:unnamed protein product [Pieris brassicae]
MGSGALPPATDRCFLEPPAPAPARYACPGTPLSDGAEYDIPSVSTKMFFLIDVNRPRDTSEPPVSGKASCTGAQPPR